MKKEIYDKIISKKEFSNLPKADVELAFSQFDNSSFLDEEKIKLTRDLLRKVFSAFVSQKLFSKKFLDTQNPERILSKHLSTKERFPFYRQVYSKILSGLPQNFSVIDLGAGINGLSYSFFRDVKKRVNYIAIEAMGQLVELMNYFFKKNKLDGAAHHVSLFNPGEIKKLILKTKKPRVIFLFKTVDSLEMLRRNYSKKFLLEIVPLADRVAVSFATRSLVRRVRFRVQRSWIVNFIDSNFKILRDFEVGGERYIVFSRESPGKK